MMTMRSVGPVLVGLCLGACAPASHPAATTQAPPVPQPAPAALWEPPADAGAASAPAALVPASVLLRAKDFFVDGQGKAEVWLDDQGRLHVGARSIAVEHVDPQMHDYFWQQQASLKVVALSKQEMAVVLASPTPDDEDPPNRFQVFLVRDNALLKVFDAVVGVYGMQGVSIPGNGSLRYVEDGWTACERMGTPSVHPGKK